MKYLQCSGSLTMRLHEDMDDILDVLGNTRAVYHCRFDLRGQMSR
jgi:hypothetical protein